ncbi:hypothetical protein [Kutzneria buriramensis]|uniref:2'-5' RNA ligase superfamily protein n=1 Tax=Kutzneria buriramensis TaxID=1045776 RepID=A0A3E0GWR8_9PSEU|nr:hypothetical protein [Kutzneria buriramensis]REH31161.1 hypothetical protein BCF44_122184 [Kutzneria buriramensis]
MRPFPTGDSVWPAGETRLHAYLIPDLERDPDLGDLVNATRAVLADYPIVPVRDAWLHATVQPVTGRSARTIDGEHRARLITALRHRLADLPPLSLLAGPPLITSAGVVLDLIPDNEFDAIVARVRGAITAVLGEDAVDYDARPGHLAIGYAAATPSVDELADLAHRLRRIRPNRATLTVEQIHLVDVEQDARRHQWRWTEVAAFPLRTPAGMTA